MAGTNSAAIRERCGHPIVDSDGHLVEFGPLVFDYIKQVGGPNLLERYAQSGIGAGFLAWYQQSPEQRLHRRMTRPPWWPFPARNTLDRATATLPRLLYERLPEIGLDFTVLYPTLGLFALVIEEDEVRRAVCRAFNTIHADLVRDYADRMTAVAVIPMHTPEEAIAELEYAVDTLGLKAILMAGHVLRPVPAVAEKGPRRRDTRTGSTPSRSTASTTTTRCGRSASNWVSCRPFTPAAWAGAAGTRRPTTSTITSAISPRQAKRSAAR